jgi:hypothetical protein
MEEAMPYRCGIKMLLVLIALCLGALVMAQFYAPEVAAAPSAPGEAAASGVSGALTMQRGPTSLYPLRWRIPWAVNIGTDNEAAIVKCLTQVSVVVPFEVTKVVRVNVEFFDTVGKNRGDSVKMYGKNLNNPPAELGAQGSVKTDDPIALTFNSYDLNTGDFQGYALVNADDPRVFVSAHMFCEKSGSMSFASIPAYPVGATLEYFQAGMPMMGMPPMAIPQ